MGLIKAAMGAVGGALADQWREFFYCDALDQDVLVVKGEKRISGRSSNTKGNDNIISNGSGIAVADGQCMIIVEQGKIVERRHTFLMFLFSLMGVIIAQIVNFHIV